MLNDRLNGMSVETLAQTIRELPSCFSINEQSVKFMGREVALAEGKILIPGEGKLEGRSGKTLRNRVVDASPNIESSLPSEQHQALEKEIERFSQKKGVDITLSKKHSSEVKQVALSLAGSNPPALLACIGQLDFLDAEDKYEILSALQKNTGRNINQISVDQIDLRDLNLKFRLVSEGMLLEKSSVPVTFDSMTELCKNRVRRYSNKFCTIVDPGGEISNNFFDELYNIAYKIQTDLIARGEETFSKECKQKADAAGATLLRFAAAAIHTSNSGSGAKTARLVNAAQRIAYYPEDDYQEEIDEILTDKHSIDESELPAPSYPSAIYSLSPFLPLAKELQSLAIPKEGSRIEDHGSIKGCLQAARKIILAQVPAHSSPLIEEIDKLELKYSHILEDSQLPEEEKESFEWAVHRLMLVTTALMLGKMTVDDATLAPAIKGALSDSSSKKDVMRSISDLACLVKSPADVQSKVCHLINSSEQVYRTALAIPRVLQCHRLNGEAAVQACDRLVTLSPNKQDLEEGRFFHDYLREFQFFNEEDKFRLLTHYQERLGIPVGQQLPGAIGLNDVLLRKVLARQRLNLKASPNPVEAHPDTVRPDLPDATSVINTDNPDVQSRKRTTNNKIRHRIGGKGFFLTTMQQAGIPVPAFQCVDTDIGRNIEKQVIAPELVRAYFPESQATCIEDIKQALSEQEPETRQKGFEQLARLLTSDGFYQTIAATGEASAIRSFYQQLQKENKGIDTPVIARSSGVAEDSYGDAQAGKYDSKVKGQEDIVQTYLQVIASGYRNASVNEPVPPIMPVILQQCIACQTGGVAMSYSTLGDNTIQINSAPGQPRTAVGGDNGITPDLHSVNRSAPEPVITATPGSIDSTYALVKTKEGGYEEQKVSTESMGAKKLTTQQINELTSHIKTLEKRLLCPVDVEFGIDKAGQFFILQVRPITRLPGAMRFNARPEAPEALTGTVVSEGFCRGVLYHADGPSSALEEGNIVVAEHFHPGMLEPEFLAKASGFIFRHGGLNDHVAITLRQAGKPYFIAGESATFPEREHDSPQKTYTMACGHFGEHQEGVLWQGDHVDFLQKKMTSVVNSIPPRASGKRREPPSHFDDPGKAFTWLNKQNTHLLQYFSPNGVFPQCLEPKAVVSLAMSTDRQQFITALEQETNNFLKDTQAFIDGYDKLLALSTEENSAELTKRKDAIATLKYRYANLNKNIQAHLQAIKQPFKDNGELPEASEEFSTWQQHFTELQKALQQLTPPKEPKAVQSCHDIIFMLHKEFIDALPHVCQSSGKGEVTNLFGQREKSVIDFTTPQCQVGLSGLVLMALGDAICNDTRVVNTDDALVITADLGLHKCVIESLAQGDGGKGRMLRVRFSDDISISGDGQVSVYGKRPRMLLVALLFEAMNQKTIVKHFDPDNSELIIEQTHLQKPREQEESLLKAISILFSLSDIDLDYCRKKSSQSKLELQVLSDRIAEGLKQPENDAMLKSFLVEQNKSSSNLNKGNKEWCNYLTDTYAPFMVSGKN
ncbi:PEP/pyruvate-binding domain-containing protein [Endozoicomonas numazuensis]|uniref:Phosphoenolpyruvate synthase n=1 Tax=Endozoicomonas numazuensis TaxID=1137799 RepID=A0A081NFZ6_9GAMM|nr:PEP/pyruvate-binding domain-containing protein [Endozoicomonas numazuensis]KEQ17369.1 hypothetical protein GZ78_16355 [Endozoicomonas numazuensis]